VQLDQALGIAADGGVAVEDEEMSSGKRAIAAVVMDGESGAVAAVELAVPAEAYSRKELSAELGPKLIATARDIAWDLGGRGSPGDGERR
jgi:DNA-binding IclR family transcriptional regulator